MQMKNPKQTKPLNEFDSLFEFFFGASIQNILLGSCNAFKKSVALRAEVFTRASGC